MAKKNKHKKRKKHHIIRNLLILIGLLSLGGTYYLLQDNGNSSEPLVQRPPVEQALIERAEAFVKSQAYSDEKIGIFIYDLTADAPVYARNEDQLMPPASCTKLITAVASMGRFGLDYTFKDSLFYQGTVQDSILLGNLYLQADADPMEYEFSNLITGVKVLGIKHILGEVRIQTPLRETMLLHPSWAKNDMRVSSLPVLFKGHDAVRNALKRQLAEAGISLTESSPVKLSSYRRTFIAEDHHTLGEVLNPVLKFSSNILAQCLWTSLNGLYCRYIPDQQYPQNFLMDFIGKDLGIPPYPFVLNDACGLSPGNRLTPKMLTHILRWAWEKDEMREYLLEALPVSGNLGAEKSGSLHGRMERTAAAGKVFAKTGTLNSIQVTSLSGYLETRNKHWLVFSIMNQGIPVEEGRTYQDKLCIELCR